MAIINTYTDDTASTSTDKFLTVDSAGATVLTPLGNVLAYIAANFPALTITDAMMATAVKPVTRTAETQFDFVASGGVWSGLGYGTTLTAAMTALVCYQAGQRLTVATVSTRAFTASKDTYIDVLNTAGVGSLVYTEVANNAASPALAANSIRLGKIISGATNILNAASVVQLGSDSLANQYRPSTAVRPQNFGFNTSGSAIIGVGSQSITSASAVALNTTTFPPTVLNIPAGYKVLYFGVVRLQQNVAATACDNTIQLADNGSLAVGGAGSTGSVFTCTTNGTNGSQSLSIAGSIVGLSAGLHTISVCGNSTSANQMTVSSLFIQFMVVPN